VNLQTPTDFALLDERKRIEEEKMRLADERREMEEERKRRETAKANTKIDLRVTASEPDPSGLVLLSIQTGVDTSSLKRMVSLLVSSTNLTLARWTSWLSKKTNLSY
jgi:hypothetical protein